MAEYVGAGGLTNRNFLFAIATSQSNFDTFIIHGRNLGGKQGLMSLKHSS